MIDSAYAEIVEMVSGPIGGDGGLVIWYVVTRGGGFDYRRVCSRWTVEDLFDAYYGIQLRDLLDSIC